jgi:uncharacterized protein (DUF2235 family)
MIYEPKNIVICLDGTGNQFKEHNSNIVTLYSVLEGTRVEGERVQEAYYDPGVGTLADPAYRTPIGKGINKALGMAFGRGLTRNITEAYSYLMDTYRDGDRIYVFGFSRGAYTARALAGFLYRMGLLHRGCQNLIPYAMKLYKKANFKIASRFRQTYGRPCPVHFLGLFDTVTTYGFVYDPVHLPNTTKNPSVRAVRHAISIDERRVFFRQNHWDRSPDDHDVKEVWFAGVHSDVGGGYAEEESGLAKVALQWMIEEAVEAGMRIDDARYREAVLGESGGYTAPSATAQQHKSLKGPWWIVEFLPQRYWSWENEKKVWHAPRPNRPRSIRKGSLHASVLERLEKTDYDPPNLPPIDELTDRFEIERGKN